MASKIGKNTRTFGVAQWLSAKLIHGWSEIDSDWKAIGVLSHKNM